MRSISYFCKKEVQSFTSILWDNFMFQFGISVWQKKIKWKCFDIVHIGIYLLRYSHIGIHLLPFLRKKVENSEMNFWVKEGNCKLVPQHKFFKCLNAPRFKSSKVLLACSFFLSSKVTIFSRIEWVSLDILKWSLCGLLPFVRKG